MRHIILKNKFYKQKFASVRKKSRSLNGNGWYYLVVLLTF